MKPLFNRSIFSLLFFAFIQFAFTSAAGAAQPGKDYFAVYPYVQLGYQFNGKNLVVTWLSETAKCDGLDFEYRADTEKTWQHADKIQVGALNGQPGLKIFSAEMKNLPANSSITYRLIRSKLLLFQSAVRSAPAAGNPFSFAVFGDVGQGTDGEARVASLLTQKQPPLCIITGDITYPIGTVGYYRKNFFPYLNSDEGKGSPLLRSSVTVTVPGNHDITSGGVLDSRNLDQSPDSLAYFVLWKQPLNGPLNAGSPFVSKPSGSPERVDEFLRAAAPAYPRMANFSFDYGDCHFLMLDANSYMDWTDAGLRQWVESDLKNSKARWKFVSFHQPGFHSDVAHREEQRMRHLADIFERCGVDVCFSGHTHSYQRSCPLRFKESQSVENDTEAQVGFVRGSFKLDRKYDGVQECKPDGVIYIVSGAGGAALSRSDLEFEKGSWLPFTKVFSSRRHSATLCRVDGKNLSVEQIADDGSIVDRFVIAK